MGVGEEGSTQSSSISSPSPTSSSSFSSPTSSSSSKVISSGSEIDSKPMLSSESEGHVGCSSCTQNIVFGSCKEKVQLSSFLFSIERAKTTYISDSLLEIPPVLLISTQKPNQHTRIQPTHRHLPHSITMECFQFRGTIRRTIMELDGIQPSTNRIIRDTIPILASTFMTQHA